MEEIIKFLKSIETEMKSDDANIHKLHFKRNRYLMNIEDKHIIKKLKQYKLIDTNLIRLWKMVGYENLCCVRCIQPIDHKDNKVCKCRVPYKISKDKSECGDCGCTGCAGY